MINSIELTNFQSHRHTIIHFSPGLTVISGSSDKGKSASTLRPLRWVREGRPLGESIKNWDSEEGDTVRVEITTDKACIVKERTDGKAKNILNGGKPFEAVKQDVPEEIINALGLSDINIQMQHDKFFLLDESPGEVAKKLNEMVGLDVIDRLYKFLNGRITDAKRSIDEETNRCNTLSVQVSALDYLDELEDQIEKLDALIKKKDSLLAVCSSIEELIGNVKNCREKMEPLQKNISYEDWLIALCVKISSYLEKKKEHEKAISLVTNLKYIRDRLIPLQHTLTYETWTNELLRKVTDFSEKKEQHEEIETLAIALSTLKDKLEIERDWLTVEDHYNVLIGKISEYQKDVNKGKSVVSVILTLDNLNNQKLLLIKQLEIDRVKYKKLLMDNKLCPLCGSTINKRMVDKIFSV